jgi:membrane protein involved in colicin uptake
MIKIREEKNNFMRFVAIFLSVLIFTSFNPLSEVKAKIKCDVNKKTSTAYYKCKAKEAKKLAKKKTKAAKKAAKKTLKNNPVSGIFKQLSNLGVKPEDMEKIEDGLKKSD